MKATSTIIHPTTALQLSKKHSSFDTATLSLEQYRRALEIGVAFMLLTKEIK